MPRHVPSDLLWTLVRDNSSFLKKQVNLPVFSAEPSNLTGLNSFKYSGLANKKACGIKVVKNGSKDNVMLSQKVGAQGTSVVKTGLKKCSKKGAAQLATLLSKGGYRRDLIAAATKKYSAVLKSFKKAKVQKQNQRIVARKAATAASKEE